MSRQAREKSQTGLYHIISRGISRQNIFEEDEDYRYFLRLLEIVKQQNEFFIYAYCLMSNHVHMFIKEKETGDVSAIMHKILTRYAGWYNRKYLRSGSLFGNRYKSEPVEDDGYLLTLIRYIHQNPKKEGIVRELEEYEWSSYSEYIGKFQPYITDTDFILDIFSKNKETARNLFIKFHDKIEIEEFTIRNSRKMTEEQIRRRIMKVLNGREPHFIGTLKKTERNKIIKELKEKEGFSIREIERVTGISRGIISRIR